MVLPRTPFLGIESFLYSDHPIFFAREDETRELVRHVVVYRGVFVFGESGAGKSSLINAGLIPAAVGEGLRADRVRVQPEAGGELVVERIPLTADLDSPLLPSTFAVADDPSPRLVLSTDAFRERLQEAAGNLRPLLIFDQFEELITHFEEAQQRKVLQERLELQKRIVDLLVGLLRDDKLPVKLVFAFREDYLAKVQRLLAACPELMSQALRLTPPRASALRAIIRGPFEAFPGHFDHELSPELATKLERALESRDPSGTVNLTEVQVVCLRLWNATNPDDLLEEKGVQGLLEDYLWASLNAFPEELRFPAIALLNQMVTPSGARNVISAEDLIGRVRGEEEIPEDVLLRALARLDDDTRLVRRERRRDLFLYEITSEFLVPWISRRQEEAIRTRELEKAAKLEAQRVRERRNRQVRISALVLLILVAVLSVVTAVAMSQRGKAIGLAHIVRSQRLAELAEQSRRANPTRAVLLSALAVDQKSTRAADAAFEESLATTRILGVLRGHKGAVYNATFSTDGRLIATAGADGTARIWKAKTLRQIAILRARPLAGRDTARNRLFDAVFTHDGRLLATGGEDGVVRIWDVKHRKLEASLSSPGLRPRDAIYGVDFNRAGTLLAAAHRYGRAVIWSVAKRRSVATIPLRGYVVDAVFDPKGKQLAVGGSNGIVVLWDIAERRVQQTLHTHGEIVVGVAFSADGRRLLTTDLDGSARIWKLPSGVEITLKHGQSDDLNRGAFAPSGHDVMTFGRGGAIWIWDADTGRDELAIRGGRPSYGGTFSADGSLVVTGLEGGNAIIRSARRARVVGTVGPITSAEFALGGRSVLAVSGELARLAPLAFSASEPSGPPFRGEPQPFRTATFSPDGRLLVTTGEDPNTRIWDVPHRRVRAVLPGDGSPIRLVRVSPDGRLVLTISASGGARLWRTSDGGSVRRLRLTGTTTTASFSADSQLVMAATREGRTQVWRTNGRLLATLHEHSQRIDEATLSRDGRRIVVIGGGEARIWSLAGRSIATLRTHHYVSGADFGPDDKTILTSGETPALWNASNGRLITAFPSDGFAAASFSPDGSLVLTVGAREVKIWDAAKRKLLKVVARHADDATFAADGRFVLVTQKDRVLIWDVRARHLRGRVRARVSHGDVFASAHQSLALVAARGRALLVSLPAGTVVGRLSGPPGAISSALAGADGTRVVTRSEGKARLWNASTGTSLELLEGGGGPNGVQFSPDGRFILETGKAGVTRIRSASNGATIRLVQHQGKRQAFSPTGEAFSPNGKYVLTATRTTAWITPIVGGASTVLRAPGGVVAAVAWSPDGSRIVTAGGGRATLWDAADGRAVSTFRSHLDTIVGVTYSPDGELIATTNNDGTARIWRAGSGDEVVQLNGSARVSRTSFNHDGKLLLTTSVRGAARVWDTETGGLCAELGSTDAPIADARFVGNGDQLLTIDQEGTVRLEYLETCALARAGRLRATAKHFARALNDADRRAFLSTS